MRAIAVSAIVGIVAAVVAISRRPWMMRDLSRDAGDTWRNQVMTRVDHMNSQVQSLQREVLSRVDRTTSEVDSMQHQLEQVRGEVQSQRGGMRQPSGAKKTEMTRPEQAPCERPRSQATTRRRRTEGGQVAEKPKARTSRPRNTES